MDAVHVDARNVIAANAVLASAKMTRNWFPKIDYKKCTACLACVNFCTHRVYAVEKEKPIVKNPDECIELCRGCEKICPNKAIKHVGGKKGR